MNFAFFISIRVSDVATDPAAASRKQKLRALVWPSWLAQGLRNPPVLGSNPGAGKKIEVSFCADEFQNDKIQRQ